MLKRTITAVALLAFVFVFMFWLRMYSLIFADAVCLIFALVGAYEMFKSLKKAEYKPFSIPLIISAIIVYPLTYFLASTGLLITMAVGSVSAITCFIFTEKTHELKDLMATVFNIVYPLVIMSILIVMNHSAAGLLSIVLVFCVVVLTDTMAYFVGVSVKGKKLCPSISPKKTISGAIGGLIGGMAGGAITFALFDTFNVFSYMGGTQMSAISDNIAVSLPIYLLIGLIGAVVAELGDLGASIIKRKIGIKDYGNIFPGHGGVMDRIDSFLFVVPIVFVAFEILYLVI